MDIVGTPNPPQLLPNHPQDIDWLRTKMVNDGLTIGSLPLGLPIATNPIHCLTSLMRGDQIQAENEYNGV